MQSRSAASTSRNGPPEQRWHRRPRQRPAFLPQAARVTGAVLGDTEAGRADLPAIWIIQSSDSGSSAGSARPAWSARFKVSASAAPPRPGPPSACTWCP